MLFGDLVSTLRSSFIWLIMEAYRGYYVDLLSQLIIQVGAARHSDIIPCSDMRQVSGLERSRCPSWLAYLQQLYGAQR